MTEEEQTIIDSQRAQAARRGCTCTPDVAVTDNGDGTRFDIGHAAECALGAKTAIFVALQ